MSLNPFCESNRDLGKRFRVLGDPPFPPKLAEIAQAEIREVLPEAVFEVEEETRRVFKEGTRGHQMGRMGISAPYEGMEADVETITVYSVKAHALGWHFRRAWYYWVCSTEERPIPEEAAKALDHNWGATVRVDGFAGGQKPMGAVDMYHVDAPDGLCALIEAIRRVNHSNQAHRRLAEPRGREMSTIHMGTDDRSRGV